MPSPNDNISLKDGNDNPFKMRAKDVSVAQDGSLQALRHLASLYPVDYGNGGCYQITTISGTMAAGLGAASPIWGFRFTSSTTNAIVRRVQLSMSSLGTGFAAGLGIFDLSRVTGWTADDSGGALTNGLALRTAMPASTGTVRTATTAALTVGTRVLSGFPFKELPLTIPTATNTAICANQDLFSKQSGDHPLVVAQNEGIVLNATVPATGVWSFAVMIEWDEVPLVNY